MRQQMGMEDDARCTGCSRAAAAADKEAVYCSSSADTMQTANGQAEPLRCKLRIAYNPRWAADLKPLEKGTKGSA